MAESCEHERMLVRTTNNMQCDPWWWECEGCEKQFVDRELLARAKSRITELEQERLGWKSPNERDETIEAANLWESRCHSLQAQLQAVTQERDTARETSREMNRRNQELQHTLNIESGRKAWKGYFDACWRIMKDDYDKHQAIQAHNKAMRKALEAMVNERYSELDMQTCGYSRGTPEAEAWHQGVFSMWAQLNLILAPGVAALRIEVPKP